MIARFHLEEYTSELDEVLTLPRLERVLDVVWNDVPSQMVHAPHSIRHSIAVIRSNHSATEMTLQCVQNLHIALVLHDGEFRENLKSGAHVGLFVDPDVKASFPVHEACDPLSIKFHRLVPNVKSLRVPGAVPGPSLRIVPLSVGFLLPREATSTERLSRSFPHMVGFY